MGHPHYPFEFVYKSDGFTWLSHSLFVRRIDGVYALRLNWLLVCIGFCSTVSPASHAGNMPWLQALISLAVWLLCQPNLVHTTKAVKRQNRLLPTQVCFRALFYHLISSVRTLVTYHLVPPSTYLNILMLPSVKLFLKTLIFKVFQQLLCKWV